jgi:hypothetical protein
MSALRCTFGPITRLSELVEQRSSLGQMGLNRLLPGAHATVVLRVMLDVPAWVATTVRGFTITSLPRR